MTKKIALLALLVSSLISYSQKLENCAACSSTEYTESDIANNELFELQLLRNEIFARHNYSFKNNRLETYFASYDWYKPDSNNPIKKVNLNAVEKLNIKLFKAKEVSIKKNRALLISELKKLRDAIKNKDNSFLNTFLNEVVKNEDESFISDLLNALAIVLNAVDLNNLNWHKGQAKYEIVTDNGFSISSKNIYIIGNSVSIMLTDPMKHSDLMKNDEVFEFPSGYYSEAENTNGAALEFKNGKLILMKPFFAG